MRVIRAVGELDALHRTCVVLLLIVGTADYLGASYTQQEPDTSVSTSFYVTIGRAVCTILLTFI